MSGLPILIVQSLSDHGDAELGKQPPQYSAVYPDISSPATPPPSPSFPFLLPVFLFIFLALFLTIYLTSTSQIWVFHYLPRYSDFLLTGNRADWATVSVVAIVAVALLFFAIACFIYFSSPNRGGG